MPRPLELGVDEAVARLRSRDSLGLPLGPGQPTSFLHALGGRDDWEELAVFAALLMDFFEVFTRPGVRLTSGFFGPVERALVARGCRVAFLPSDFRRFAPILERLRPRVMATAVTPPDADGRMSLSLHAGATIAELHRCGRDPERLLIVEQNPRLPRTLGLPPEHPHSLSLDEVDWIVRGERDPLELPSAPPNETQRRIAEHARHFIPEGATLQAGIGAIPNALVSLLAEGEQGDYGIHSEMFGDGLMHLHRAGKVTNRKGLHDGYSVATFAVGSRALYDWLDGCEELRFLPVEEVNTPQVIGRNRRMTSVNGALAIDLFGQVAADTLPGGQHSGIGGHEDFSAGAGLPESGRSLLCLPSTVAVDGKTRSRIHAALGPGFLVTTPRHQLDVVVTEHGAVDLKGLIVEDRARALISIAHPDFRDALSEEWRSGMRR